MQPNGFGAFRARLYVEDKDEPLAAIIAPVPGLVRHSWRHKESPVTYQYLDTSSLSDLKNRSEKVTGRGQILTILKANSCSIGRKSGEI